MYNKTALCGPHQKENAQRSLEKLIRPNDGIPTAQNNPPSSPSFGGIVPRSPEGVLKAVAELFGCTVENILDKDRRPSVVTARFLAIYLLKLDFNLKFLWIAKMMRRESPAMAYGFKQITARLPTEERLVEAVKSIRSRYEKAH